MWKKLVQCSNVLNNADSFLEVIPGVLLHGCCHDNGYNLLAWSDFWETWGAVFFRLKLSFRCFIMLKLYNIAVRYIPYALNVYRHHQHSYSLTHSTNTDQLRIKRYPDCPTFICVTRCQLRQYVSSEYNIKGQLIRMETPLQIQNSLSISRMAFQYMAPIMKLCSVVFC